MAVIHSFWLDPTSQDIRNSMLWLWSWGAEELKSWEAGNLWTWGVGIWGIGKLWGWRMRELRRCEAGEFGESRSWGVEELGSWEVRELWSWGVGELRNWGAGKLGS